ncbi:IS3 family transposase [Limnoglobus roseus]|uniref:IS3 family transposase n=1 Tax=Limnoglobus roseus TaxID=2598579 RepID=A0A5C1AR51_9BACT|nr:IS3 family transposase [Limnoglobus roseus]
MARPRTTYTAEYKLAAVKMMTAQKLSVAEVAHRLNVGRIYSVPGGRRSRRAGRRPSRATATRPRPTRRSAACGPKTHACGPSGTC